jgi:serine/threonine-protein kinase SRPK3
MSETSSIDKSNSNSSDKSNSNSSNNSNSDKSNSNSNRSSYSSNESEDNNIDLTGDIINNYNIISALGKGSYSRVWLAYNIGDGKYYALKVQNPEDFDDGKEEINILKKIPKDEPYINKLVEYFVETRFVDETPTNFMCSVYSLCGGNLDGFSRKGKYKNGYPEHIVKKMFKQILLALHTVHYKLNGFHGDVKPDNILLYGLNNRDALYIKMYEKKNFIDIYNKTKKEYMIEKKIKKLNPSMKLRIRKKIHAALLETMDENEENQYLCNDKYFENPLIKLSDFGFYCSNNDFFHEQFGTRYYMAPEILLMSECDEKVDIWALGCVLYELLTGRILFDPHSDEKGSTDFHHFEMIINLCGEFNGVLKSGKYYNKFFKNNKLKNIEYSSDYKLSTRDKINKKLEEYCKTNINNLENSRLIESMLQINPKKRPSIKDLLKFF